MNTLRTLRIWLFGALLAPLAVGCPDAGEGPGDLTLKDASYGGCEGTGLDRPVALGARLDVEARLDGQLAVVSGAELLDPTIFSLLDPDNPIGLRADAVGTTELRVTAVGGATAAVPLEVADVASVELQPWELVPFNLATDLSQPHPGVSTTVAPDGYALLPDGALRVDVTYRDAQGRELGGYDVATWSAAPDGAVTFSDVAPRSDDRQIAPAPAASGPVTVSTDRGGSFTVVLAPSGAASTMQIYVPETGVVGDSLTLQLGEQRTVVAVVYDVDGRFLLGDDGDPFDAAMTGDAAALIPPPWSEGEDAVTIDAEAQTILEGSRVTWVEGQKIGTATLTLTAAGLTLDVPVTVVPVP